MTTSLSSATKPPFAVVVQAEIKPDRMDEFKEMIQANAVASRKEPGCLRFGTCYIYGKNSRNTFVLSTILSPIHPSVHPSIHP
jgi:antibiotic biosynthesis monooxygenase (ABM) superfamily enzyme